MASALISLCVTALVVAVTAESPGSGGFGGGQTFATPASQGVRYAGPIVYTNEKPPVIHFPPPPAHSLAKMQAGFGSGSGGNFGKGHSVKYVPLPHHDLPVLIYQSDISPPIHVVHPTKQGEIPQQKVNSDYGSFKQQNFGSTQQISYSRPPSQKLEYDPLSADFSTPAKSVYRPSQHSQRPPKQQKQQHRAQHQQHQKQHQQYRPPTKSTYSSLSNFEYTTSQSKNQYRAVKPYSPPKPKDLFGSGSAPPTQQTEFSLFNLSKPRYEQPKKSSPLPHIIYAGHPPIHIFQQPPIYMAAPKGPKYSYTSTKSAYIGSPKNQEYLYTSESSPPRTVYGGPKPTFGPTPKPAFGPVQKPKTEYRSSPKPEYRLTSSKAPQVEYSRQKPDYGRPKPASYERQKTEYERQKGEYSSSAPVYVRPQQTEYVYRPQKTESSRAPKIWSEFGSQLFGSYSQSSPMKYKSSKQVTYSPAPKNWHKPPIIIYQGVKPPVHMFENVVSFDSVHAPGGSGIPSNYATRRISSAGEGMDPSNNVQYLNTGNGFVSSNPNMWIPAYGLQTQNGYQTTLYVSDLTSAGTTTTAEQQLPGQPQVPTPAPVETQTVQVTTKPEGSQTTTTTSQVTITTQADEVKGMTVTESSLSANTPDQTSSADESIDSLPQYFLAAGVNDQNSALNSIPMSYTSVMVQSAGSQPYRVI